MCGRFSIFTPLEELRQRLDAAFPRGSFQPRYNAAPGQNLPVIPMEDPKNMYLYRWGLIPHWAQDKRVGHKLINARAETLSEKPAFRGLLRRGRCLVLADGFYEWSETAGKKIPYRIELAHQKPFAMAGLCVTWKSAAGETIASFTIITTEANDTIRTVHHRMPVILEKDAEGAWLDPRIDNKGAGQFLAPYTESALRMYPVSTLVNNPNHDSADIIKPVPAHRER